MYDGKTNLPIINATMQNEIFKFHFRHTTDQHDIIVSGNVNADSNAIEFILSSDTPAYDLQAVTNVFMNVNPYIELYCSNRKCNHLYYLASYPLQVFEGKLFPLTLFIEQFSMKDLVVQNNWTTKETNIYSGVRTDAIPLKTAFINFDEMTPEKLLKRIKTIVVFS